MLNVYDKDQLIKVDPDLALWTDVILGEWIKFYEDNSIILKSNIIEWLNLHAPDTWFHWECLRNSHDHCPYQESDWHVEIGQYTIRGISFKDKNVAMLFKLTW